MYPFLHIRRHSVYQQLSQNCRVRWTRTTPKCKNIFSLYRMENYLALLGVKGANCIFSIKSSLISISKIQPSIWSVMTCFSEYVCCYLVDSLSYTCFAKFASYTYLTSLKDRPRTVLKSWHSFKSALEYSKVITSRHL